MEVVSKPENTPPETAELRHMSMKLKDQRTKVHRRVPVVYYLCRNGHLEHPHFVEVPLSSSDGLYLRDVIDRLNFLRGKGMAALYSWSSKRSYKNGFVWHDLSENDYIHPSHGHEYILKGSEFINSGNNSDEPPSSISNNSSSSTPVKSDNNFDVHEYKVYSGETSAVRLAADASTQTESTPSEISELSRTEVSPPPSDSSTETLESLMKSDGKLILRSDTNDDDVTGDPTVGSKVKASSVLMQLISCGSLSFRVCGPGKENPKRRMLPRGEGVTVSDRVEEGAGEVTGGNDVVLGEKSGGKRLMVMEDREYFSGSLIETKKDEFPTLKRSNSYNANG